MPFGGRREEGYESDILELNHQDPLKTFIFFLFELKQVDTTNFNPKKVFIRKVTTNPEPQAPEWWYAAEDEDEDRPKTPIQQENTIQLEVEIINPENGDAHTESLVLKIKEIVEALERFNNTQKSEITVELAKILSQEQMFEIAKILVDVYTLNKQST